MPRHDAIVEPFYITGMKCELYIEKRTTTGNAMGGQNEAMEKYAEPRNGALTASGGDSGVSTATVRETTSWRPVLIDAKRIRRPDGIRLNKAQREVREAEWR